MDPNTLQYWRRLRKLALRRQTKMMKLRSYWNYATIHLCVVTWEIKIMTIYLNLSTFYEMCRRNWVLRGHFPNNEMSFTAWKIADLHSSNFKAVTALRAAKCKGFLLFRSRKSSRKRLRCGVLLVTSVCWTLYEIRRGALFARQSGTMTIFSWWRLRRFVTFLGSR